MVTWARVCHRCRGRAQSHDPFIFENRGGLRYRSACRDRKACAGRRGRLEVRQAGQRVELRMVTHSGEDIPKEEWNQ